MLFGFEQRNMIPAVIIFFLLALQGSMCIVCSWRSKMGICLPANECYGKHISAWDHCGKNVCCLNPVIARNQCQKYTQNCKLRNTVREKIIGGEEASPKELPYMVAIGFGVRREEIDFKCGGSLISPNFVLTAAHCLIKPKENIWILAGTNFLNDTTAEIRKPWKIMKHPKYNNNFYKYDIALISLKKPFPLSDKILPACLVYEHELMNATKVLAAGWGKIDEDDDDGVDNLQKVEQDIIGLNKCKKYHPTIAKFNGFLPSMLCAGELKGGKDTCQGDSGGPLVLKLDNCSYGIAGVVSSGTGCGWANSPAIYSRVPHFVSWIAKTVWDYNN